jgi:hypothetical protein
MDWKKVFITIGKIFLFTVIFIAVMTAYIYLLLVLLHISFVYFTIAFILGFVISGFVIFAVQYFNLLTLVDDNERRK